MVSQNVSYGEEYVYIRLCSEKEGVYIPKECKHIACDFEGAPVAVFENEELAIQELKANGFKPQRLN